MLIPEAEATRFLEIYPMLLGYAAGKLGGVGDVADEQSLRGKPLDRWLAVRDALFANIHLIDAFCVECADRLPPDLVAQVRSWRHAVVDDFVIERDLKRYTVFLTTSSPTIAYGVLGLTTEVVDMLPLPPPVFARTVLLPWKDAILCDGLIACDQVVFGGGIKRSLRETYNAAKRSGIVTSLDPQRPAPTRVRPSKPKTPAIERFLRRCPRTVVEFVAQYGEPHMDMGSEMAREYCTWEIGGRPVLDVDYVLIYANIIRHQVLYVYAKDGMITHVSVVDPTDWRQQDKRPPKGRHLLT